MYCKNCGQPLQEHAVVCLNCGVRKGDGNKYCANCGAQPDPLAAICVKCGCNLRGGATPHKANYPANNGGVNSFGGAIKACWSKYATFEGRANRSEYWYWILFYSIFAIIPYINLIAALVFLLPTLAVLVRRLHDIGKSGWNYFFNLIPFVGGIILLIWCCKESDPDENEYGPNPNIA